MWKGKLHHQYLATGQQGYASAAPVVYPEGIEVIDCALGTNPLGTPPAVRRFLDGLKDVPVCGYPRPEPENLKGAIASKYRSWRILPEQILVSGGSMGVLVTLSRLMLAPGTSFTGVSPSSPMRSSRPSTQGRPTSLCASEARSSPLKLPSLNSSQRTAPR